MHNELKNKINLFYKKMYKKMKKMTVVIIFFTAIINFLKSVYK